MGKKPKVVLSDQQESIRKGLETLKEEKKWDGVHLIEECHSLRNLDEDQLKGPEKTLQPILKKIIRA